MADWRASNVARAGGSERELLGRVADRLGSGLLAGDLLGDPDQATIRAVARAGVPVLYTGALFLSLLLTERVLSPV